MKQSILVLLFIAIIKLSFSQIGTIKVAKPEKKDSVSSNSPVSIKYIYERNGKPPLTFYCVDLTIENKTNEIKWYLFPYWGSDSLKSNGIFIGWKDSTTNYVSSKKFSDSLKSISEIIEITFYGTGHFRAFCLQGNSYIHFSYYVFDSWKYITDIDICEADSLLINSNIPIEKILPYNVISSKNASVINGDYHYLDWDYRKHESIKYSKQKINYIQAKGIKKYRASLNVCKVSFLIQQLNKYLDGDSSYYAHQYKPLWKPYDTASFNIKDSIFKQNLPLEPRSNFEKIKKELDSLEVKPHWSYGRYVFSAHNSQTLIDELNELVKKKGDIKHISKGTSPNQEAMALFEKKQKIISAYAIEYVWNENQKKYVLKHEY